MAVSLGNTPPSESTIQKAFIAWCRLWSSRPGYEDLAWLFSVPNGGARSKGEAGKMKGEGVVAGAPDLLWLRRGKVQEPVTRMLLKASYLAIEMKRHVGVQSPQQRDFQAWVNDRGGAYIVCRGAGAAALAVCVYAGWGEGTDIYADACELAKRDYPITAKRARP